VLDQWLYHLYYDGHSVDNYGWIDYRKARFSEITLSVEALMQLYVIEDFRGYVINRAQLKPFDHFLCNAEDREYWETHGTWRVPPIVLDAASFSNVPAWSELGSQLQLMEGHTRFGYLIALELAGMLEAHEHKVFFLRNEE